MLDLATAIERILQTVHPAQPEKVELQAALGCVLAESIICREDSPPFDKSMVDGFAVCTSDFSSVSAEKQSVQLNVIGELTAGKTTSQVVRSGQAIQIMTGAPTPQGADAVVPVELTETNGAGQVIIQLQSPLDVGTNIIPAGQNMRQGAEIFRPGHVVRPQEIALLAEMGYDQVTVHPKPTIAILATGDELVSIAETPGPGQIRNSNATMLAAQVRAAGGVPVVLDIARDFREDLQGKIAQGLECDFLCLSGGVSAGKLDLVPSELAAAQVEQVFHKVAMKPGKPIWFGHRQPNDETSNCYVFGLPGNPVSSMVCFELFVKTAMRRFAGRSSPKPQLHEAQLKAEFLQSGDREVWFPSYVEIKNGELVVTPTGWKGSSDLRSTVDANCSVRFPPGEQKFSSGQTVQVLLWSGSMMTSKLRTNDFVES